MITVRHIVIGGSLIASIVLAGGSYLKGREHGIAAGVAKAKAICSESIAHNQKVENEYLKDIAGLNARIVKLRRLPNVCVPIPARKPDAAGGPGHASAYGAHDFYEYGAECERYRLTVKGFQEWAK